ncbi:MAG TPA: M56 family metallopeptidase [Pirellulales bacterium]|jgi:cobalt-zinc-cadmium efflux system membrane fusion protein
MIFMTDELLLNLGRTTLTLAVAVLLIGLLLRAARVSAPSVHRAGCLLALAVGWTFLQWPVHVPWYDAAGIVDDDPSEVVAAIDTEFIPSTADPTNDVIAPPANDVSADTADSSSVPLATIELPHEDLSSPLGESQTEETAAAVPTFDETPATPIAELAVEAPMAGPSEAVSIDIASDDVSKAIVLPDDELAAAEGTTDEPTNVLAAVTPSLGTAWISGILALVSFWLVGYIRFVRRLPCAREGDADWLAQWQSLLAEQNVRAAVPLRVTHDTGPMLCRLPRGYELLVPGSLWRELSVAERAAILRHELAHLVRGDVWKSLAARVLALPHWFNPFAWWAVRRFDEAAEWSCDRAAAAENSTTAYARALLRLGEAAGRHAAYSPAARGRPLASRIRRLLAARSHEDSPTKKALLLTACIGFAVAALVRVELVAQEAPGAARPGTAPDVRESVVAPEDTALALADGSPPSSSEHSSISTKSSLEVLADQSRGKIHFTADELTARGLRLAIVRPAEAEQVRVKGKTNIDKKAASHVRAFLPGIIVAISPIEGPAGEKARPIGFDTEVKQGQVLATVWSKELADKAGELIDADARLNVELQALNRLRLAEKGAVATAATWEAERQVATAKIGVERIERTLRGWRISDEVIKRWREAAQTPTPKSERQPPPEHAPGNYPIVSPLDGLIIEKNVHVGDIVDSSRDLFLIADTATMPVMVEVPEEELPKLQLLPADARRWLVRSWSDKPDQQVTGTFDLNGAIHHPALHNFIVHGTLESPDRRIPFRQTITATVSLPANLDLVTIPAEAVLMDPGHGWGRIFVEAKDKPTQFELRKVEIVGRAATDGMLLIRSAPRDEPGVVGTDGLAAGEKILASADAIGEKQTTRPSEESPTVSFLGTASDAETVETKEAAPPTQPVPDVAPADGGDRAKPRFPEVIEAARTGYEMASVEYDQDRITLDQICDWSLRLLQAESSSEVVVDNPDEAEIPGGDGEPAIRFPNDQERLAFERSHLARMTDLQQRIVALYKIGARGGEAEKKAMMDYYVAEAERSLARLQRHIAAKKRSAEALAAVKKGTGGGLRAVEDRQQPHEDAVLEATDNEVEQGIKFSHDAGRRKPSLTKRTPWKPADDARTRLRYDGRTFEDWVTQLDTDLSLQARNEAIGALAAFGQRGYGAESTKKLVELLSDEEVQPLAIRALGKIGPAAEEAIPALEEAAKNEERHRDATQAIARIRGEKVESVSARALLAKRETKLRELLQQKSEQLVRNMHDVEGLQKNLGIVDPATAAAQNQMLQQQLAVVNNSIFSHTSQLANLEVEIDKVKLDIELARDPAAREARAEEEMLKDDRLRTFEAQLIDAEIALDEAREENRKQGRDPDERLQGFKRRQQSIEDRIHARRDELMKKFSDSNEAVKIKEYEGKKLATEKHRDSVSEQLKDLKQQQAELTEKLSVMTRDTAELDVKRARIRVQQEIVDKLEHELQAMSIEKLNLDEASPVPELPKQSTAVPQKKLSEVVRAAPAPTTAKSSQASAQADQSPIAPEPNVGPTVKRTRATATIRDGKGVALLRVMPDGGGHDNNGYQTYRTTIKEWIRSKSLLARVVHDPTIAQLPLMQSQTDPENWLRDNLQVSFPDDGELLEIALAQVPFEQAKQIVDAVVDTYFREVVEKSIAERAKKAEKLAELHKKKMAEVDAERKRLQALENLTDQLNTELQQLEAEQKSPRRVERVVQPPKDDSSQRSPGTAPAATPANNLDGFLVDQEQSLRNELQTKTEAVLHGLYEFENLRRSLGVADPIEAAERSAAIHRRLAAVDQELRQRAAECLSLDAAIGKLNEEIAWRKDEAGRKARIAEVLQNDVPLLQFEEELAKRTKALQAAAQPDEAEKLAIGALSQKRDARREQLIADATAMNAWKLREAVGSLAITHRKRDRLQEQMALLTREDVELTKQAEDAARATLATGELEAKKQQIKELQAPVDDLNKKLYEISKLMLAAREKQSNGPAAVLAKREKLEQLLATKRDELAGNEKGVARLSKMIGATDAADVPRVRREMDQQLLQLDKELFDRRAQCANLENELDQLRLDIELARDPHVQQGRIAEEIKTDDKLKKLSDQSQDLNLALAAAKQQVNGDNNPTLKRLEKARTAVEGKIALRRQEITDRLSSEEGQLIWVKEKQDKLVAVQKHRDDVKQGLDKLKQQREALLDKQKFLASDASTLESSEQRIQALKRLVDDLETDLKKMDAEQPRPAP